MAGHWRRILPPLICGKHTMNFDDKVALVTGARSGIRKAAGLLFAKSGAKVAGLSTLFGGTGDRERNRCMRNPPTSAFQRNIMMPLPEDGWQKFLRPGGTAIHLHYHQKAYLGSMPRQNRTRHAQ
jgi:hypothetical protein